MTRQIRRLRPRSISSPSAPGFRLRRARAIAADMVRLDAALLDALNRDVEGVRSDVAAVRRGPLRELRRHTAERIARPDVTDDERRALDTIAAAADTIARASKSIPGHGLRPIGQRPDLAGLRAAFDRRDRDVAAYAARVNRQVQQITDAAAAVVVDVAAPHAAAALAARAAVSWSLPAPSRFRVGAVDGIRRPTVWPEVPAAVTDAAATWTRIHGALIELARS